MQPFQFLQYATVLLYSLQNNLRYAIAISLMNLLTIHILYCFLRQSIAKIKAMAEGNFAVRVKREGEWVQLSSDCMVPGDIYQPGKTIPCDSIVIEGDAFVSEVSFTGENIPVVKTSLKDTAKWQEH